jgi:hypothetical protein
MMMMKKKKKKMMMMMMMMMKMKSYCVVSDTTFYAWQESGDRYSSEGSKAVLARSSDKGRLLKTKIDFRYA